MSGIGSGSGVNMRLRVIAIGNADHPAGRTDPQAAHDSTISRRLSTKISHLNK
jgi:hypothetical protein